MPLFGIQSGPSTWNAREFAFTGVAHLTYGTVMALVLDALDNRGR